MEDPKALVKPWITQLHFQLKPEWDIMELACTDNAAFEEFRKVKYYCRMGVPTKRIVPCPHTNERADPGWGPALSPSTETTTDC